MYKVTGSITYSTTANRTTALNAMQAVLDSYPSVEPVASAYPAGLNTSGTNIITVSVNVPDDVVETFRMDLKNAWTAATRTTAYVGAFKV